MVYDPSSIKWIDFSLHSYMDASMIMSLSDKQITECMMLIFFFFFFF